MITNKIDIGNKKVLLDGNTYYLNINRETNIEIVANNINKLIIIGTSNYHLKIIMEENSQLTVNSINKDNSSSININLKKGSSITYNHSTLTDIDSVNEFIINHLDSDSTSIINNNGINRKENKLFFNIDGIIPKNLLNINCNQSSKILNYSNGNSKIIPNLIIDSNDIVANHAAYIGEINEEELFYLESRGIEKDNIKMLMYKGTMLGKMELTSEKEEFNQILNEWW
jgi:Fe-S cluster assembly scaffold protein SufB